MPGIGLSAHQSNDVIVVNVYTYEHTRPRDQQSDVLSIVYLLPTMMTIANVLVITLRLHWGRAIADGL